LASASQLKTDEYYMRMALSLAMQGTGTTSPNPRVGCVIVRDGQIIGKGWHQTYGGPHAEVNAVKDAGGDVRDTTVYVNLEPCCHYGKTPPCAGMLIESGISRVVVGMTDPNPLVDCKGIELLKNAGIEVAAGILENECKWLNRGFIMRMKYNRPWVTLKIGASLDGNIALKNGSSKWITGAESREKVHMLRAANDAIITGVGTVLADDPELTVREAPGKIQLRAVLDTYLQTPEDSEILKKGKVIFFAGSGAPIDKIERFRKLGAEVEIIDSPPEKQLDFVLYKLCQKGVNYLMVEAGAGVTSSFLSYGCADELSLFVAPKFMGAGLHYSEYIDLLHIDDSITVKNIKCSDCGSDLWIKGVFSCSPDL
jgi:diaminohydroxyphosphoribosylaminopyrimidine deaminase/5-amino-6-(5-phosphoribosylamino)uracil reductase